jgi:hexosaminidase
VQLLDLQGDAIPRGSIIDWPDYPVRGFLLDVGRRFVPTATVLDLIHHIARFKLNTFILHLNDNEIVKDTGRSWDAAQHGFRLRSDNPDYAVFAARTVPTAARNGKKSKPLQPSAAST